MTEEFKEQLRDMYYEYNYSINNIKEYVDGLLQEILDEFTKCSECGETDCEWLQENEGNCCNDCDDIEQFKGCPPCNDEKLANMTDTAVDMAKERNL